MFRPHRYLWLSIACITLSAQLYAAPPWKRAYRAQRDVMRAQLEYQQSYQPRPVYQHQKQMLRQEEKYLREQYRVGVQPRLYAQPPAQPYPVQRYPIMQRPYPKQVVVTPAVPRPVQPLARPNQVTPYAVPNRSVPNRYVPNPNLAPRTVGSPVHASAPPATRQLPTQAYGVRPGPQIVTHQPHTTVNSNGSFNNVQRYEPIQQQHQRQPITIVPEHQPQFVETQAPEMFVIQAPDVSPTIVASPTQTIVAEQAAEPFVETLPEMVPVPLESSSVATHTVKEEPQPTPAKRPTENNSE